MANIEARVARLERRQERMQRKLSGRELVTDALLDLIESYEHDDVELDIIEQGVEYEYVGPMGGRSGMIPLLVEDAFGKQHNVMIHIYSDNRIDQVFASHEWLQIVETD